MRGNARTWDNQYTCRVISVALDYVLVSSILSLLCTAVSTYATKNKMHDNARLIVNKNIPVR